MKKVLLILAALLLSINLNAQIKLYGMTFLGGAINAGVIFEWDPATNIYTKKIDFDSINGCHPKGALILKDGKFYGMTYAGGTNNMGVIFEWDPATNIYTNKINFSGANGCNPNGKMTLCGGNFYGMTFSGGTNSCGNIFKWNPSTNTCTKLNDLTTMNGTHPDGSLTLSGGKLYGMTQLGGIFSDGVIFEFDTATNVYTKKIDLNTGSWPFGSLTMNGGKFYGMTNQGGAHFGGIIFEWDPASNVFTKKIDLSAPNGANPYGDLFLYGGKFYGMTGQGGANGKGVIFEWDPATNTYTNEIDLSSANGSNPSGLLTMSGGKFYGMTALGGANGNGVIFEWDPATNTYTDKIDLIKATGWNPSLNQLTEYCPPPVAPANITLPANQTVCIGNSAILSASGTGSLGWYDAATGGNYLGSGANYTSPLLTANDTFYVQDSTICGISARTAIAVTIGYNGIPVIVCPANITVNNNPGICSAVVTFTAITTNNCPGFSIAQTAGFASGAAFPAVTTTNIFKVTDASGNTATCSFTVTVSDNQVPAITCPSNISINNTTGTCSALVTYTTPVGTDNCSVSTTVQIAGFASGTNFPVGITTNTFNVTDANGNTATCSFSVTVNDNQNPTITCPSNISVVNDPGIYGAIITYNSLVGTDNCMGVSTVQTAGLASGATFPIGVTTNAFKVTDASGNSASCSFTVTVNNFPRYVCVAKNDTLLNSKVYQFDVYIYEAAGSLQPFLLNNYQLSFSITNSTSFINSGTITGTYVNGSSELKTDSTQFKPMNVTSVISGALRLIRINGPAPSPDGMLVPLAGLKVGTFKITNSAAYGQDNMNLVWNNAQPYITMVIAMINGIQTDITDFPGSHSTILTNPVLNKPVTAYNMTGTGLYCQGGSGFPVGLAGSETGVQYRLLKNSTFVGSNIPGTGSIILFGNQTTGTYTSSAYRKATYLTGTMNGSASVATAPIPVAEAGNNQTVCAGSSDTLTATGGTLYQWNNGIINGVPFVPTATTTYTVTVSNANGCTSTDNVTITVIDNNEIPMITCPADVSVLADAGKCTASNVSLGTPITLNNCRVVSGYVNGIYPTGITSITWTATNVCGNTATCIQKVTVTDNEIPTITCNSNVTATTATGLCYATVTLTAPATSDNCGVASVTNNAPALNQYPLGPTIVNWTVTDNNGLTNICNQLITVNNIENPVITCPADIYINNIPGTNNAVVTYTVVGTDNCPGATTVQTKGYGSGATFPLGITTNTFKVTDIVGNTATCSFTVTVVSLPSYTCIVKNDTLLNSKAYQFDIYIYEAVNSPQPFYLNNYQFSFKINNSTSFINGGTITGKYVNGSTEVKNDTTFINLKPTGVNYDLLNGIRINGPSPSTNDILIPQTGLRIGTFQISNSADYGQDKMNLVWQNNIIFSTHVIALFGGLTTEITDFPGSHSTILTNPILNKPVTSYNMTGTGIYCPGISGLAVGLDGSETGVQYLLLKNSIPVGPNIPGTGSIILFGNQTTGTYTCSAYRKATYLAGTMNDSAIVSLALGNPVAEAGNNQTVCSRTSVTLAATGGTSYQWNNGVTNGIPFIPTTTTTYTVTVTNVYGCTATDNVKVTVNALPLAEAGNNQTVCTGANVTLIATGGTSYQWNNGVTNGIPFVPTATTTYTVTVSNANGCTATDNVQVTISQPIAEAGNNQTVCAGTSVILTATGGTSYQWNNGVTNGVPYLPTATTTYAVTVSNAYGCTATDNVLVTVNPNITASVNITAYPPDTVCAGTLVAFTATPTNGGTTPIYQWKINGITAGANSSVFADSTLQQGDIVSCILTSNATPCLIGSPATSNSISMSVISVKAPVFTIGPISTRSQGTGSLTYNATANYTTGITYSLAPPIAGSINTLTGKVVWNGIFNGTATITASAAGCNRQLTANHVVTVNPVVSKTLYLKIFLEGFYKGSGAMNHATTFLNAAFMPKWNTAITDTITVELHDTANYSQIVYTTYGVQLKTNGLANVFVPNTYGGIYYLAIIHRNHLKIVSAKPVSFAGDSINYNFTDNINKALGNRQKNMNGTAVIYAGDITSGGHAYPPPPVPDGVIDISDIYYIFSSYLNGDYGYLLPDISGDGTVDLTDVYLAFNNYLLGVYTITP